MEMSNHRAWPTLLSICFDFPELNNGDRRSFHATLMLGPLRFLIGLRDSAFARLKPGGGTFACRSGLQLDADRLAPIPQPNLIRSTIMRMYLSNAAAVFVLLAGVGVAAADDIIIQPEQDTVIREYVKKQPLASVKVPGCLLYTSPSPRD